MFPRGLLQEYASALSLVARLLDIVCVICGAYLAYYWRFGHTEMESSYHIAMLIAALITVIVFSSSGVYTSWRGKSWFHQARVVTLTWLAVTIILIIIAFLTKTSTFFSRQWMAMWTLCGWALLLAFRLSFYKLLRVMREKGWNHKRIVVVGVGELANEVAKNIKNAAWTGLDIIAFFDDQNVGSEYIRGIPVKNDLNKLSFFVEKFNVNEVWLAMPLRDELRMKEVLNDLRNSTVTIRFVPGIFEFRLLNHAVTEVAGLPVIDLNASPMVGVSRFIKALEDKFLALLILVLVSPLMLCIALAVKFTSTGPVFFKQLRHGWDGKPINIYKFRTMVVHCEENGTVTQACKNDNRITRLGAFLRRTSLDELPQFINVLQGRMSIVGPRPHALQHNEHYKDQIDDYMQRHKVKPGITGWAQVHGWRGETDTLDKMKRRVEFDLYYIENWSLWLDLKIVFLTLFAGFVNKNAY